MSRRDSGDFDPVAEHASLRSNRLGLWKDGGSVDEAKSFAPSSSAARGGSDDGRETFASSVRVEPKTLQEQWGDEEDIEAALRGSTQPRSREASPAGRRKLAPSIRSAHLSAGSGSYDTGGATSREAGASTSFDLPEAAAPREHGHRDSFDSHHSRGTGQRRGAPQEKEGLPPNGTVVRRALQRSSTGDVARRPLRRSNTDMPRRQRNDVRFAGDSAMPGLLRSHTTAPRPRDARVAVIQAQERWRSHAVEAPFQSMDEQRRLQIMVWRGGHTRTRLELAVFRLQNFFHRGEGVKLLKVSSNGSHRRKFYVRDIPGLRGLELQWVKKGMKHRNRVSRLALMELSDVIRETDNRGGPSRVIRLKGRKLLHNQSIAFQRPLDGAEAAQAHETMERKRADHGLVTGITFRTESDIAANVLYDGFRALLYVPLMNHFPPEVRANYDAARLADILEEDEVWADRIFAADPGLHLLPPKDAYYDDRERESVRDDMSDTSSQFWRDTYYTLRDQVLNEPYGSPIVEGEEASPQPRQRLRRLSSSSEIHYSSHPSRPVSSAIPGGASTRQSMAERQAALAAIAPTELFRSSTDGRGVPRNSPFDNPASQFPDHPFFGPCIGVGPDGTPIYHADTPDVADPRGARPRGRSSLQLLGASGQGEPLLVSNETGSIVRLGPDGEAALITGDDLHRVISTGLDGRPIYISDTNVPPPRIDVNGTFMPPPPGADGQPVAARAGVGLDGKPLYIFGEPSSFFGFDADERPFFVSADDVRPTGPVPPPAPTGVDPERFGRVVGHDARERSVFLANSVQHFGVPTNPHIARRKEGHARIVGVDSFGEPLYLTKASNSIVKLDDAGMPTFIGPADLHALVGVGSDGAPVYITDKATGDSKVYAPNDDLLTPPGQQRRVTGRGEEGVPLYVFGRLEPHFHLGDDGRPVFVEETEVRPLPDPAAAHPKYGDPVGQVDGGRLVYLSDSAGHGPQPETSGPSADDLAKDAANAQLVGLTPWQEPVYLTKGSGSLIKLGRDGTYVYVTPDDLDVMLGVGLDGKPLYITGNPDGSEAIEVDGRVMPVPAQHNCFVGAGKAGAPRYIFGLPGAYFSVGKTGKPCFLEADDVRPYPDPDQAQVHEHFGRALGMDAARDPVYAAHSAHHGQRTVDPSLGEGAQLLGRTPQGDAVYLARGAGGVLKVPRGGGAPVYVSPEDYHTSLGTGVDGKPVYLTDQGDGDLSITVDGEPQKPPEQENRLTGAGAIGEPIFIFGLPSGYFQLDPTSRPVFMKPARVAALPPLVELEKEGLLVPVDPYFGRAVAIGEDQRPIFLAASDRHGGHVPDAGTLDLSAGSAELVGVGPNGEAYYMTKATGALVKVTKERTAYVGEEDFHRMIGTGLDGNAVYISDRAQGVSQIRVGDQLVPTAPGVHCREATGATGEPLFVHGLVGQYFSLDNLGMPVFLPATDVRRLPGTSDPEALVDPMAMKPHAMVRRLSNDKMGPVLVEDPSLNIVGVGPGGKILYGDDVGGGGGAANAAAARAFNERYSQEMEQTPQRGSGMRKRHTVAEGVEAPPMRDAEVVQEESFDYYEFDYSEFRRSSAPVLGEFYRFKPTKDFGGRRNDAQGDSWWWKTHGTAATEAPAVRRRPSHAHKRSDSWWFKRRAKGADDANTPTLGRRAPGKLNEKLRASFNNGSSPPPAVREAAESPSFSFFGRRPTKTATTHTGFAEEHGPRRPVDVPLSTPDKPTRDTTPLSAEKYQEVRKKWQRRESHGSGGATARRATFVANGGERKPSTGTVRRNTSHDIRPAFEVQPKGGTAFLEVDSAAEMLQLLAKDGDEAEEEMAEDFFLECMRVGVPAAIRCALVESGIKDVASLRSLGEEKVREMPYPAEEQDKLVQIMQADGEEETKA